MAFTALPDPVIGLIAWLKDDHRDFWPAGIDPDVTFFPQTAEGSPIYEKGGEIIGIKSSGVGSGTGQLSQGNAYESMRIDAIATGRNDFEAYRLGKLMHNAILQVRGQSVSHKYDGIDYTTKFITIVQTGGPAPFQDTPGGGPHWRHVMYVYNVNFASCE